VAEPEAPSSLSAPSLSVTAILSLVLLAIALSLCSLLIGPARLGLSGVVDALAGTASVASTIIWELRLPRALLALLVGAALGVSGAVLQALLRNPLADPSVLGASNSAALGGVVALYFGFAKISLITLPMMAIGFGLISLLILLFIANRTEGPLGLILAGIAIGSLSAAAIALALNRAPSPFAMMEISFWLMGSLEDRSFEHVWIALPCVLTGLGLMAWRPRDLDALVLGEEGAQSLGVNLKAQRLRIVVAVAFAVGGAVAVSGSIGFVGLIAPHLVRPFTDGRPSRILLLTALVGAALVAAADIFVHLIPGNDELRLGVVTAFLGVPFFIAYLLKERRVW